MEIKYYAAPLHDFTVAEIRNGKAGEIEMFDIKVPSFNEETQQEDGAVIVTVVSLKGYELSDADHARIGELINE